MTLVTVPRKHRPLTDTLTPSSILTGLCNDLVQLHAHLDAATTPQAVFDGLADGHDHLIRALRLMLAEGDRRGEV